MKPTYESPLASRYASMTMLHLFSPDMRFETWRRLSGENKCSMNAEAYRDARGDS